MSEDMPRRLPKFCFEEKRPSGVRVRLRRPGCPTITIPGVPWSEAFMAAYAAAFETAPTPKPVRGPEPGTWEWLCRRFFASAAFSTSEDTGRALSGAYCLQQRKALESTFGEPLAPGSPDKFGQMPLPEFTPKAAKVLRDRMAKTPAAANQRLKAMRRAFAFGVAEDIISANPAREVRNFRLVSDGFYTWSEDDIAAFEAVHGAGTRARRALYLMLYTGPRTVDVVRMGRQMLYTPAAAERRKLATRWLRFTPKKTEGSTGRILDLPVLPALQDELDRAPKDRLLFLETAYGQPFSVKGFANWFKDRCVEAGLPQCSAHGLRKAGATILAERGATPYQLMAIYGWSSLKEAERYTRKAQSKQMAEDGLRLHIGGRQKP